MPRRFIKRYMPDPEKVRTHKSLRILGTLLHHHNLWQLNRHSVARAVAVGLFCAFVPIPMQMLLAACIAIVVRSNLPISVGLVWLTNPVTMPPVFYATYKFGAWLMQVRPQPMPDKLTLEWVGQLISTQWQPFLLGALLTGVIAAFLGYTLTMVYWRWWVRRSWKKRMERRRKIAEKKKSTTLD